LFKFPPHCASETRARHNALFMRYGVYYTRNLKWIQALPSALTMSTKWCYLHSTHAHTRANAHTQTQLLLYCARWSAYRNSKAKRLERNEEKATKEDRKTGTKETKQDTKRYKTKEAEGLRIFFSFCGNKAS